MAASIKHINHQVAIDLWFSAKRLIFFCGSGVSQFSPTGLPTGWKLVQASYQALERQFLRAGYHDVKLDDLARLPLETLLGFVVEDIADSKYTKSFSEIAAYFRKADPNRLHFLLSSFIYHHKNCHIITTNYDLGFEKAIKQIRSFDTSGKPNNSVKVFGVETLNKVRLNGDNLILKIHGCASLDRPQNLILTTKQESSGLPQAFLSTLQGLFEDSLVVFLGYSLSEPDCLEALMSVSNFDVIWVDRNLDSLNNNFRAQIILGEAREAYYLENLIPFIELPWTDINPSLSSLYFSELDNANLRQPFSVEREEHEKEGVGLFEKLLEVSSKGELIKTLILAYSHLRDFQRADAYLEQYEKLKNHSEFNYYMWKASITRDKNINWKRARVYFEAAANLSSITPLEKSLAQELQFGLESLMFQDSNSQLLEIKTKLLDLISHAKRQLNRYSSADRLEWLSILGRAQKNLVQNLSYQKPLTLDILKEALGICDEAIRNLTESQDIHGRIETERLKARVCFRIYKITGDKAQLDAALMGSERALRFFSLLSGSMGIVNAKRQYALMLIESNKFDEASKEIQELNSLLHGSPDNLSRIKVIALETYLYLRTRRIIRFVKNAVKLATQSRDFTETESKWKNIIAAMRWYISLLRGTAG